MAVRFGVCQCGLAVGWERMDEVDTRTGNFYISTAACKDFETRLGRIYASYYGSNGQPLFVGLQCVGNYRAKIACEEPSLCLLFSLCAQPGKHTVEEVLASPWRPIHSGFSNAAP